MSMSLSRKDGIIWTQNRGGEDVACVPSASSVDTMLKTRILEQAHQVVGHYRAECSTDYIRRWYWWPHIYSAMAKFCKSCEI